jgi:hypothetical protein
MDWLKKNLKHRKIDYKRARDIFNKAITVALTEEILAASESSGPSPERGA